MITGKIKFKVDLIRDTFWSGGIANPLLHGYDLRRANTGKDSNYENLGRCILSCNAPEILLEMILW
jgi:hypothetical protein